MEQPDIVYVERIDHNTYKVFCEDEWRIVCRNDVGFGEIDRAFPIIKAAHGVACKCEV